MFLASLNLDYFFKKVFSNKNIAKSFLEDVLGVTISTLQFLNLESKISDDAVTVKFDFRCKIHGRYIVIEMQQTYKPDVIKRFYMYHAMSTVLQLELLKPITRIKPTGEKYTEKNYSTLEPVLTLIWMVDDVLGFDEDFVVFSTLPEAAKNFITDKNLWEQSLDNILVERKKVLNILENDTKGLDFFAENRVIYIFQKNIVKNKRVNLPYYKWFEFASKSKNRNNEEKDFDQYKKDKDMAEVIKRLRKDKLTKQEFDFANDYLSFELSLEQLQQEKAAERKEFLKKQRKEREELMKEREERIKAEQEKIKEREDKQLLQLKLLSVLMSQGISLSEMAKVLGVSLEETTELLKKVENLN